MYILMITIVDEQNVVLDFVDADYFTGLPNRRLEIPFGIDHIVDSISPILAGFISEIRLRFVDNTGGFDGVVFRSGSNIDQMIRTRGFRNVLSRFLLSILRGIYGR